MKRAPHDDPEALPVDSWCALSERAWSERLETSELLHQWGSAYLVDDGEAGVRVFVRNDSDGGGHAALRLGPEASARAREGVVEVETAARACADLITASQQRERSTLEEVRREEEAGLHFIGLANALYKDLLRRDG